MPSYSSLTYPHYPILTYLSSVIYHLSSILTNLFSLIYPYSLRMNQQPIGVVGYSSVVAL